jgi:uncharacterized membrane protein YphA (DoxX/SURF4 family)
MSASRLASVASLPRRLDAWLDALVERRENLRSIALMRVLFGAIVIRHLWPDLQSSITPVERFHVPWWSWLPLPSPSLYRVLLWIGVAAGLAMLLGLVTRLATVTAFAVVSYLVFVDMTGFAHNRGFLVWMLFGLSLLPTGAAYTVLNLRRRFDHSRPTGGSTAGPDIVGPVWPVLLLQVVVSSMYLTSGTTKLLNPDWRSGLVLWDRTVRQDHLIPFDDWIYDMLTSRTFHYFLSPSAIAVELFLGIGLWFGRTRRLAVALAILFHASIEITASVQTFSYSAIAALLIWSVPTLTKRDRA